MTPDEEFQHILRTGSAQDLALLAELIIVERIRLDAAGLETVLRPEP